MRKNCTREAWLEIKDSNIMDIKDDDMGILKGLLLSYHHMPPQLKLCFMYCSIFRKSHDIDHDSLIQQWIALGFIQGTDVQLLQKIGTKYINEFLGMSFLNILRYPTVSEIILTPDCIYEITIICIKDLNRTFFLLQGIIYKDIQTRT
jgi:aquaporin TIP